MEVLRCRTKRYRWARARYLRIMDNMHQGRGGLHELPPQRTARAHAVEDGRRPLPSPTQAVGDRQRSPLAHAAQDAGEESHCPSSTEFEFLAGAELLCRRERHQDCSGFSPFYLFFNLRVFIKE